MVNIIVFLTILIQICVFIRSSTSSESSLESQSCESDHQPIFRNIFLPTGWHKIDVRASIKSSPFFSLMTRFLAKDGGVIEVGSGYGIGILHWTLDMEDNSFVASFNTWPHFQALMDTTINAKANRDIKSHIKRFRRYPEAKITDVLPFDLKYYIPCINTSIDNSILYFKAICDNPSLTTYGYDVLNRSCPQLIIFNATANFHDHENSQFLNALVGANRIITDCHPTIFVEKVTSSNTPALIELLKIYNYESIYWYISEETTLTSPSNPEIEIDSEGYAVSILAVSNTKTSLLSESDIETYKLIPYDQSRPYLHQYDLSSIDEDIYFPDQFIDWMPNCIDGSLPPCHTYLKTTHSVDMSSLSFNDETKPYVPHLNISQLQTNPAIEISFQLNDISNPWRFNSYDKLVSNLYEKFDLAYKISPRLSFVIDFVASFESHQYISYVHCFSWIQNIYKAAYSHGSVLDYANLNDNDFTVRLTAETAETKELVSQCVQFSSKQYIMKREALVTAAIIKSNKKKNAKNNNKNYKSSSDEEENILANNKKSSGENLRNVRFLNASIELPFKTIFDDNICFDPVWCAQTQEFQRRIRSWQFPEEKGSYLGSSTVSKSNNRTCASSKFLLYEPHSEKHGIGSMIEQIATAFRFALCHDRILVFIPDGEIPTMLKWRHPGCRGNMFECYFEKIHGCDLEIEEMAAAPSVNSGKHLDVYPLVQSRIVRMKGLPLFGKCKFCGGSWDGSRNFLSGLVIDQYDMTIDPNGGRGDPDWAALFDASTELLDFNRFTTQIRLPWIAQFQRYLLRPRQWFADYLRDLTASSLRGPNNTPVDSIPHPFVSMHVRYGFKFAEDKPEPLSRYITALDLKWPGIKTIFVSTETDKVLSKLRKKFPDLQIYSLKYPRIEYLQLQPQFTGRQDYVQEFIYSMANLHVATQADGFVGTLSSNWCRLIQGIEHTRGDGGAAYISVDRGSAYSTCV